MPGEPLNGDAGALTATENNPSADAEPSDEETKADLDSEESEDVTIGGNPDGEADTDADKDLAGTEKAAQSQLDEALTFCELSQSLWQKGELDQALEALDRAYALVLEADTKQDAKLIQQKEDLRFLISKRILEIYASRNIVVNGSHDEIPMEMNSHIQAELASFTVGCEKEFFLQAYQRSGQYRPYIVQALKEAGLPEELSWLPLIESGFKVKALSRARALGLWQFIPSTGYKYGLKRTDYVDERMDYIKSTRGAIDYLKELHSIFGDWSTVLAAYNCGEGRVLEVIRTQNVNYLDNFWDLYQRLPRETARYVPRFLATLHIIKNPERYGLNQVILDQPMNFDMVDINRQVHLKDVAIIVGADPETLGALNPELRYQILPSENYRLRIPQGKTDHLLASLDNLPTSTLPQRTYTYHRVRSGETLSMIAKRYNVSISTIKQANNLGRTRHVRAGRHLKIPTNGSTPATVAAAPSKSNAAGFSGVHAVRKGDSLWNIASRYGTTVQQIVNLNNLTSSDLYIGQKLKMPGYKPEPLPETDQLSTYYVQRGDTPFNIAQRHNMALERFLKLNQLTPGSKIYPGQKLFLD
jgi:membrane-bound lytic murein transglycosylase D